MLFKIARVIIYLFLVAAAAVLARAFFYSYHRRMIGYDFKTTRVITRASTPARPPTCTRVV